ncbi:hypothetical protein [Intestinicryptomonas porci]|uniref:hypothetical protein n=1 Tax=Intestinicryptomonas porci TaxID=2926320 RepID=UPI003512E8AA
MFYELYYKQKFELNETSNLSFKAGRISMSEDFANMPIFGNLSAGAMDSTPEAIFFASPTLHQRSPHGDLPLTLKPQKT